MQVRVSPEVFITTFDLDLSCIDRQIAELEARRDAILHGYCFTGVHIPNETIIVEDKKLWKIKYGYYKINRWGCFGNYVEAESDIIKATESEALEWLSQFERQPNKYKVKLCYKEDGDWILYKKQ